MRGLPLRAQPPLLPLRLPAFLLACLLATACNGTKEEDEPRETGTAVPNDTAETGQTDTAPQDTGSALPAPTAGTYQVLHSFDHTARQLSVDAGHLFVLDNLADRILVFDTSTLEQTGSIPTGDYPYRIESGDGYTVATATYDWTATVVDSASATLLDQVRVGEYPWGLGIHAGQLYVSFITAADPYVQPVSLSTLRPGSPFDAESGPDNLAGAGERLVLLNQRSMFDGEDDALSIHTLAGVLVERLETGGDLMDITAHSDGLVYVTAQSQDQVWAVDPSLPAVTATYQVGLAPNGICSAGDWLFVANRDEPGFSAIHPGQGRVWTFHLSALDPPVTSPRGVAADPQTGTVFLESDGQISAFTGVFE